MSHLKSGQVGGGELVFADPARPVARAAVNYYLLEEV
jgi:hypothetical protein